MKIRSKLAAFLFRLALCVAATLGVLSYCGVLSGAADFSRLQKFPAFVNAIGAIFYFISALVTLFSTREFLPRLRGAVVLLYCVLLMMDCAFYADFRENNLTYILLHFAAPILSLIDWLFFGEKNHYHWVSPLLWLILPDSYLLFAILRAKLISGSGWLLPFLNYDVYGWKKVLLVIAITNLFAIVIGYLFVSIDKLMAPRKKKRNKK